MRQIVNFIITGAILLFASCYFPDTIQVDSADTFAFATIGVWLVQLVCIVLSLIVLGGCLLLLDRFDNLAVRILCVVAVIIVTISVYCAEFAALLVLNARLDGFYINGLLPKIILAAFISAACISSPRRSS